MTFMYEDELVVEPVIIKRYDRKLDILGVLDVDGGELEHVHRREIVEVEVGDVGIIPQYLSPFGPRGDEYG